MTERVGVSEDRVRDVSGAQLLPRTHLDRAHNLTNWAIDEIAADRFLVVARDLESWYTESEPDPATLSQARADFGDTIVTQAHLASYPSWRTVA